LKQSSKHTASFKSSEFINFPLTKEQKAAIKEWSLTLEEMDDLLTKLTETDHKLTIRWDDKNEAHACWIVPTTDKHPNEGLLLSGRGSTPLKAVRQALYIHFYLFEGNWAEGYSQLKQDDLDD